MSETAIEQFWEVVNGYEQLLKGGIKKEIPPCPVDIPLSASNPNENKVEISKATHLDKIIRAILNCQYCGLCDSRSEALPGDGNIDASILIVVAAPNEDDDSFGQLLYGESGEYLDKWLSSIKLDRKKDCYLTSIVKCLTPGERTPLNDESESCLQYLDAQVALFQPKVIIAIGEYSNSILTNSNNNDFNSIPIIYLNHPKEVLDDSSLRRSVWNNLKKIAEIVNNG